MDNTALIKLAEELTDRVEALERENTQLKQLAKQASVPVQVPAAVVSADTAKATCEALIKVGALNSDQVEQTVSVFQKDPEAAHRTICSLVDALTQTKSASEHISNGNIYGGTLLNGNLDTSAEEDCLTRMCKILNIN